MSTATLRNRMWSVIEATTKPNRRFKELEEETGIASDRWKAVSLERQRPTAEMIEAVCQLWPEYAFWISTGITDPLRGHIAPNNVLTSFPIMKGRLQVHAKSYFKLQIELMRKELSTTKTQEEENCRNEIEKILKDDVVTPSLYLSYEAVLRLNGEENRYDYFELITNDDFNRIQNLRDAEEAALIESAKKQKNNITHSAAIDSILRKIISIKNIIKIK